MWINLGTCVRNARDIGQQVEPWGTFLLELGAARTRTQLPLILDTLLSKLPLMDFNIPVSLTTIPQLFLPLEVIELIIYWTENKYRLWVIRGLLIKFHMSPLRISLFRTDFLMGFRTPKVTTDRRLCCYCKQTLLPYIGPLTSMRETKLYDLVRGSASSLYQNMLPRLELWLEINYRFQPVPGTGFVTFTLWKTHILALLE